MSPEEQRIHEDFEWLNKNMYKLQGKYMGKFIAVVNQQVSIGNTATAAYAESKKRFPKNEPLIDIVPSKDCLLL